MQGGLDILDQDRQVFRVAVDDNVDPLGIHIEVVLQDAEEPRSVMQVRKRLLHDDRNLVGRFENCRVQCIYMARNVDDDVVVVFSILFDQRQHAVRRDLLVHDKVVFARRQKPQTAVVLGRKRGCSRLIHVIDGTYRFENGLLGRQVEIPTQTGELQVEIDQGDLVSVNGKAVRDVRRQECGSGATLTVDEDVKIAVAGGRSLFLQRRNLVDRAEEFFLLQGNRQIVPGACAHGHTDRLRVVAWPENEEWGSSICRHLLERLQFALCSVVVHHEQVGRICHAG